jgi:EmrB/QacA subfamily drug resistance transporter
VTLTAPDIARRSSSNRWLGLSIVCFGTMMSFLNITQTVSVLGPIQRDLHTTPSDLVWIASVYSMAVASLVLSAGTFGDLFGRRRVFATGAAVLGAGSLLTFLAQSPSVVIAGQAIAGVGGAMVIPNALALVTHAFTDPHERSGAVGIWATVSGVGLAVGPLTAGGLLRVFSWHSVFLINVGVALVVLLLTWPLVTESRHPTRKLDPFGLVLAVIAVGALNYGVIEGGNDGFTSTRIIVSFIVTVVAVIGFVVAESRRASPMLQLSLFRNPSFAVANFVAFIAQYAFVGIAVAQVLWFEQVRDASILSTALRILPLMGVYVLTSWPAGRLARQYGFKLTVSSGLLLIAVATFLMTQQTPQTSSLATAVLLGVLGVGCGFALPSSIAAAVISVPHTEGGMASASVNMFRQIGSALGASVTGTIITTGIASRLPAQLASRGVPAGARPAITHAVVADQSPHGTSANLLSAIESAAGSSFASSLHVAVVSVAIGAVVVGAGAVVWLANRPAPASGAAPAAEAEPETGQPSPVAAGTVAS